MYTNRYKYSIIITYLLDYIYLHVQCTLYIQLHITTQLINDTPIWNDISIVAYHNFELKDYELIYFIKDYS